MTDTDIHDGFAGGDDSGHEYQRPDGVPLSIAVIEAVASVADCDPTDIEPLHQYVNPDALDDLFTPTNEESRVSGTISFPLHDHEVVVRGGDEIVVYPQD